MRGRRTHFWVQRTDSDRRRVTKYFQAFITLLVIAALLLAGLQILYTNQLMSRERDDNCRNTFSLLRHSHDAVFAQMRKTVNTIFIASQNRYNPFQHFMDYYRENQMNKMIEIQDQLDGMVSSSDVIQCICLYYPRDDYTVSTDQSVARLDLYHDSAFLQSLLGMEDVTKKVFTRSVYYACSSTPTEVMSIVRTLPVTGGARVPDAYVVIDLKRSAIASAFAEIALDRDTSLVIFDETGASISALGEPYPLDRLPEAETLEAGKTSFWKIEQDGQRYDVYATESGETGWRYVYVQNAREFYKRVAGARNAYLGFCLLVVAFGMIYAYFAAHRLYRPLQHISEQLGNREVDVFDRIDAVVAENERMDQALQENAIIGRNQQLLHKMLLDFDSDGESSSYHVHFRPGENCCVLFLLHMTRSADDSAQPAWEAVLEAQCMRQLMKLYTGRNEMALIVAARDMNDDAAIQQTAQALVQAGAASVGVSRPFEDAQMLTEAYRQASDALSLRIVRGQGTICCFREIRNRSMPDYPYRTENAILGALKAGDAQRVAEAQQAFEAYLVAQDALGRTVKDFYVRLFCSCQRLMLDYPSIMSRMAEMSHTRLLSMDNLRDMSDYMFIIYDALLAGGAERPHSLLVRRVCEYIDTHLAQAPTVDAIAEEFFVSASSLRMEFRSEMGVSVKSYIDRRRVEEAKRLLTASAIKIQDIALQLGFNYAQSFIAFFKADTGLTPGEYRAQAQGRRLGGRSPLEKEEG